MLGKFAVFIISEGLPSRDCAPYNLSENRGPSYFCYWISHFVQLDSRPHLRLCLLWNRKHFYDAFMMLWWFSNKSLQSYRKLTSCIFLPCLSRSTGDAQKCKCSYWLQRDSSLRKGPRKNLAEGSMHRLTEGSALQFIFPFPWVQALSL